MANTDQYLEPRRAVSMSFIRPSRISKILAPGIVFVMLLTLAATSIVGIAAAVLVFDSSSPPQLGESAAHALVLIAASLSAIYIAFHFIATLKNEPIDIMRPPEIRIHGYCFIAARLVLVTWMLALIASSVVASNPDVCLRGSRDCNFQFLDVVGSSLAFLAAGVILTALESCHDPFQVPEILHISRMKTSGVSSSEEEDESVFEEIQHISAMEQATISRKPLPSKPPKLPSFSIPGEFPQERSINPPLMVLNSKARGWGEEWMHLVQDTSSNLKSSYSTVSISASWSSNTSVSDKSSNTSVSKRVSRVRTVTPSSSISNLSRRSPLSTMRSVEFPDVPIPTQLRYLPPVIAPPHEWNLSKTASLTQLLPVADLQSPQRRSSRTPTALRIMKPMPTLPPDSAPKFQRPSLDIKILGAFIEREVSLEDEIKLEEQAKKIENELLDLTQAAHTPKLPVKIPAGEFEKHYVPHVCDSRSRYHKRDQPSSTTDSSCPDSAAYMGAVQTETMKPLRSNTVKRREEKKAYFQRLTLGDISPELGKLWDD